MKGRPVDEIVYEYMFPKPRPTDPPNFSALLQRSLILEVRQEVHSFYGHLDTAEAKYPGLDYCHPIHRLRLSRWPWHRRLFRAFNALRLTPFEIGNLTKWEGTKWAKERYEREQGCPIRDTTADGFPDWVELEDRLPPLTPTIEEAPSVLSSEIEEEEMNATSGETDDVEYDESDETIESVGPVLNERLRERIARREAGDTSTVLDEEWEQWLKNALESGELPDLADAILRGSSTTVDIPQTCRSSRRVCWRPRGLGTGTRYPNSCTRCSEGLVQGPQPEQRRSKPDEYNGARRRRISAETNPNPAIAGL
ncbi:unnamed protein product [Parascedosporium putredinis]|uniref:Uncharacterized protein n=1 Tax=Parascedosporium putredinis TaxID=1442378 RepID=A0A9P1H8G4_9PEZI|nr:unnamed protein product [Parascedosporium putredinis]CAI8002376.1 unnamed protein product [Parascedosporium putredinis]